MLPACSMDECLNVTAEFAVPPQPAKPVIRVQGLTRNFRTYKKEPGLAGAVRGLFRRQYEEIVAAADVSFELNEGEFVGFLGPNGAGKTTTLKMLAGLLHPTRGHATVLDYVPWERHHEYRRQFALLLGQKNQLWWDLPALDSLELNRKIYDIDARQFSATVEELSHRLQVADKLNVMVRELSLGERMKMELIAALLHQPKVLLLDEPTIGLDVVSQKTVREFLRAYNRANQTTILLTSHYMDDIEALCRRVIIMDRGRVFYNGSLQEVIDRFADCKLIELTTTDPRALLAMRPLPDGSEIVEQTPGRLKVKVRRESVTGVCRALLEQLPISDINVQDMAIEEVVRNLFSSRWAGAIDNSVT